MELSSHKSPKDRNVQAVAAPGDQEVFVIFYLARVEKMKNEMVIPISIDQLARLESSHRDLCPQRGIDEDGVSLHHDGEAL
jgi:hypothetical protein